LGIVLSSFLNGEKKDQVWKKEKGGRNPLFAGRSILRERMSPLLSDKEENRRKGIKRLTGSAGEEAPWHLSPSKEV